jgi:hypothetical protein
MFQMSISKLDLNLLYFALQLRDVCMIGCHKREMKIKFNVHVIWRPIDFFRGQASCVLLGELHWDRLDWVSHAKTSRR